MTKLQEIESSGQYHKLPDALLFDEHDEHDAAGKLLRRFDKAKMQSLVDFWNKRAEGGNLAQIGPGHLLRNAPESLQPSSWGFGGRAKLAPMPDGRMGLYADLYVKKQVEVLGADGKPKMVSAKEGLAEFPKPSIELWKTDGGIDWIALLKSRPERDLGLLTVSYAKDRFAPWGDKPNVYYDATHARRCRAHDVGDKLCYGMDDDADDSLSMNDKPEAKPDDADKPDDPTKQPDSKITPTDQPLSPTEEQQAERFMCHYMKKYPWMDDAQSKYSAAMASPTNAMPGQKDEPPAGKNPFGEKPDKSETPKPEEGKENFMKPEEEVLQYKKQVDDLTKANADLQVRIDRQERVAKYSKTLHEVEAEGYQFSVDEEVLDCADFTEEQFTKHVAKIKKNYHKEDQAPLSGVSLHAEEPEPRFNEKRDMSEKQLAEVLHYVRKTGCTFEEAKKNYRKAN